MTEDEYQYSTEICARDRYSRSAVGRSGLLHVRDAFCPKFPVRCCDRAIKINLPNCGGKFKRGLIDGIINCMVVSLRELKAVFCGDRRSFAAEQTAAIALDELIA